MLVYKVVVVDSLLRSITLLALGGWVGFSYHVWVPQIFCETSSIWLHKQDLNNDSINRHANMEVRSFSQTKNNRQLKIIKERELVSPKDKSPALFSNTMQGGLETVYTQTMKMD